MSNEKDLFSNRPERQKAFRQMARRIKRKRLRDLDDTMQQLHDEAFQEVDCLECANCCKTTGPLFTDKDISRLARRFRIKPADFEAQYLKQDEDGDLVLQKLPCPFLEEDNRCSVYEDRPKACREYPHTDRRRQLQIIDLTVRNAKICPAVYDMLVRLEARMS